VSRLGGNQECEYYVNPAAHNNLNDINAGVTGQLAMASWWGIIRPSER
jgi:hypothetical protein